MGTDDQRTEHAVFANRVFADRRSAGDALADRLISFAGPNTIVLGLPRGGVPVAAEVAERLGAPLDVLIVRKVGLPTFPELAMGAVGEDAVSVRNEHVIRHAEVSDATFERVQHDELAEVERRALRFRRGRPMLRLGGANVIIVDDGIATGSTASAAIQVARHHGARRVLVAAPVASSDAVAMLTREADEVITLQTPRNFVAVGRWYRNFEPTSDEEVEHILDAFRNAATSNRPASADADALSQTSDKSTVRDD